MGLFNRAKETRKAEWVMNRRPTLITLEDTHIHCVSAGKDFDIFYIDIKNIEKQLYQIKIKTTVKEYTLTPRKIKGAGDLSEELYGNLLTRISESKK